MLLAILASLVMTAVAGLFLALVPSLSLVLEKTERDALKQPKELGSLIRRRLAMLVILAVLAALLIYGWVYYPNLSLIAEMLNDTSLTCTTVGASSVEFRAWGFQGRYEFDSNSGTMIEKVWFEHLGSAVELIYRNGQLAFWSRNGKQVFCDNSDGILSTTELNAGKTILMTLHSTWMKVATTGLLWLDAEAKKA